MNRLLWMFFLVIACANRVEGATCSTPDPATAFVPDTSIVAGHTVLVGGEPQNPRVVVFHELPGLTPHDLTLGSRLVCEGFRVYMPLMFGKVGDEGWTQKQVCAPIDGMQLFVCDEAGQEHPILQQWVRDAVTRIGAGGVPLGVIGMCLTGTFALSLTEAANVVVAVMAQPTLPVPWFSKASALDVPDAMLSSALDRLGNRGAGVFLVRARFDFIAAAEKFDRLHWAIRRARKAGLRDVYVNQTLSAHHSVLTQAAHREQDPVMTALLDMLRRHLRTNARATVTAR